MTKKKCNNIMKYSTYSLIVLFVMLYTSCENVNVDDEKTSGVYILNSGVYECKDEGGNDYIKMIVNSTQISAEYSIPGAFVFGTDSVWSKSARGKFIGSYIIDDQSGFRMIGKFMNYYYKSNIDTIIYTGYEYRWKYRIGDSVEYLGDSLLISDSTIHVQYNDDQEKIGTVIKDSMMQINNSYLLWVKDTIENVTLQSDSANSGNDTLRFGEITGKLSDEFSLSQSNFGFDIMYEEYLLKCKYIK